MVFKEIKKLITKEFEEIGDFDAELGDFEFYNKRELKENGNRIIGLGLGTIKIVKKAEQYDGAPYEKVIYFKDHDIYAELSGYYHSYSGTSFDSWTDFKQVYPRQEIVTVYKTTKPKS